MSEEIGLIYISLSQLLDDICIFLRDGVTKEAFSAETKKQAETLIRRSKTQLQQISNITNGECYMPMENEKKNVDEEEEEEDLIYMDAEEPKEEPKEPIEDNFVCPFAGVPAKDIPLHDKHGFISLKTKLILRIEKWKKIFAAIHDDWFLIYCNDKESKPFYTYCLRIHRAKKLPTTKQSEDDTPYFGLVNVETEQMLQFEAQTHKDMVQWVTRINRYHQQDNRQLNKIKEPPKIETVPVEEMPSYEEGYDEEEEHYDSVILRVIDNTKEDPPKEEEEEIYEEIMPPTFDKNQHILIPKPYDISTMPKRRQLTPLPPLPVEEKQSSESLESYDNPINLKHSNDQLDNSETFSFSEDSDEEDNYDVLVTNPILEQNTRQEKTSIYPLALPKKEEALSNDVPSNRKPSEPVPDIQPKKERPPPPKKMTYDKKIIPSNMLNSATNENPFQTPMDFSTIHLKSVKSPMKDEFHSSSLNNSEVSPNGRSASNTQHKPSTKTNQLPSVMNVSLIQEFKSSPSVKSPIKGEIPNDSPVYSKEKSAIGRPNPQPKPSSHSSTKENQMPSANVSLILKSSSSIKSSIKDEIPIDSMYNRNENIASSKANPQSKPSSTKESHLPSPVKNESYFPHQNDFSVPPNRKGTLTKANPTPPSVLTKPKIDVKIIKSLPNTKSTKQVMKLAKEISMK